MKRKMYETALDEEQNAEPQGGQIETRHSVHF